MDIKQLQPKEGVTIATVLLPDGAKDFIIVDGFLYYYMYDGTYQWIKIPFECKLLGTLDQITEDVWQTLIEMQLVDDRFGGLKYPNFNLKSKPHLSFDTATEAGMSFLEANEIDQNSIILISQSLT